MRSTLPLSRRGPCDASIAPGVRERAGRGPAAAPVGSAGRGARARHSARSPVCRLTARELGSVRYGPALVLLVIAAIWLLAASRWIATDTVVPWDAKNQFYAFFRFLATAIHSGQAPFWNPYHYGGHPSVADPQSLIFAPPFVLWALFDPAPSIRAFDLIVYAHLVAGGLGRRRAGLARGLAGGGLDPRGGDLHVRRAGLGPAAAHRHHPELRPVPGGASAHAGGAAAPLDLRSPPHSAWWRRCWRSAATTRPCCCASCSAAALAAEISRPRTGGAICASARRAGDDGHRRGCAAGGAAAADDAVRGSIQPAGGAARQGARGFALSREPRVAGGRQRAGLARDHAGLLGAELRHLARGRRHRPLVQLPVRRRGLDHRAAVVRHRRRMDGAARHAA